VVNQDGYIAVLHQDPETAEWRLRASRRNSIFRRSPLIMQQFSTISSIRHRKVRRPITEEISPQGRRLQSRLPKEISYCLRGPCSH